MSGLTPLPIYHFRRALQARGVSVSVLAEQATCSQKHLSRMLWGHNRGGVTVWSRVRACVTPLEWEMLLSLPYVRQWNDAQAIQGEMPWRERWVCGACGVTLGFNPVPMDTPPGVTREGVCPDCASKMGVGLSLLAAGVEGGCHG